MLLEADRLLPLVPKVLLTTVEGRLELASEVFLNEGLDIWVKVDHREDGSLLLLIVRWR